MNKAKLMVEGRRRHYYRLFRLPVLTIATLWAVVMLWDIFRTSDAEGKLWNALLGGSMIAFIAPVWVFVRGRVPLWLSLLVACAAVFSVLMVNAWACRAAGTAGTHFYDHWWLLLLSLAGYGVTKASARSFIADATLEPD